MRKLILSLALIIATTSVCAAQVPQIGAKAAVLIDCLTGRIVMEKNANERHYPASITKIMTATIALEKGRLDDIITVNEEIANTEGSSIYLEVGEKISLENLLYGMMLQSGNDATIATAKHISGSVAEFAKLMNKKAAELGCTNTHFVNPNGLPDDDHYSTPLDMARITANAYRTPLFVKIVSTQKYSFFNNIRNQQQDLFNENKMLWRYEGCYGVKSGYTDKAGHCLVVGAHRNGIQLIAVVMDADEKWDDTAKMLDYGFSVLHPVTLFNKGKQFGLVKLKNGEHRTDTALLAEDIVLPQLIDESDSKKITWKTDLPLYINAPVRAGQKLGDLKIYYEDKLIANVPLVAQDSVERKSLFWSVVRWLKDLFNI